MNKDKRLLQDAVRTIKELRQENKMLQTRLSGFEDALLLLKTAPNFSVQGMMHPDIAYELDKRLEEIECDEKTESQKADREGWPADLPKREAKR